MPKPKATDGRYNLLLGELKTARDTIIRQGHSMRVYRDRIKSLDDAIAKSSKGKSRSKAREELIDTAHSIIDLFEGYLEGKNVKLRNPEKKGNKAKGVEQANIYGSEYYDLEDAIVKILKGVS